MEKLEAVELGKEYKNKIEGFALTQSGVARVVLKAGYISLPQMETSMIEDDKEELRMKLENTCKFEEEEYKEIKAKIEELNKIKLSALERLMKGELSK